MYHWPGNCWWWRFPCPCSHTHIYIFMYILILMSNNLVNQSTKAISTNELRWIGPVLAVVSSGPMDLFLLDNSRICTGMYQYVWNAKWHFEAAMTAVCKIFNNKIYSSQFLFPPILGYMWHANRTMPYSHDGEEEKGHSVSIYWLFACGLSWPISWSVHTAARAAPCWRHSTTNSS